MPNFIKVDSKPFHPDTYVGPEQEDDDANATESVREKSMSIKLKVENTVRWRWLKDESGHDVSLLSPPLLYLPAALRRIASWNLPALFLAKAIQWQDCPMVRRIPQSSAWKRII